MFTATQRIRVEWAHCDPAGIIFNPHYYLWMDSGTHALLQAAGPEHGDEACLAIDEAILATLDCTGGNKTEAARRLGVTARTLSNKFRQWRAAGLLD